MEARSSASNGDMGPNSMGPKNSRLARLISIYYPFQIQICFLDSVFTLCLHDSILSSCWDLLDLSLTYFLHLKTISFEPP